MGGRERRNSLDVPLRETLLGNGMRVVRVRSPLDVLGVVW